MTVKDNTNLKANILIVILGALFFIPYIGSVNLLDWDEVNFAEASREMIVTGDYSKVMIDFEPFHEKPPLFFWIQSASMNVFGIDEFGARFPNAILGIVTLLFLFNAGRKLHDYKFGLLWALAYLGSILPHFYFKTGLIDPLFNLLMFVAVYYSAGFFTDRKANPKIIINIKLVLSAVFTSLAVMTKGPVGLLLPGLSWIIAGIVYRKSIKFPYLAFIIYGIISLLPATVWYAWTLSTMQGNGIFSEFMSYQVRLLTTGDAGHGQPFYYHFAVLFAGCFPSSILMFIGYNKSDTDNSGRQNFKLWNKILLYVVLIVFSIVKTKIVHYSSLAYFPITYLAANGIYQAIYNEARIGRIVKWLLGISGVAWALVFIALPLLLMNIGTFLPMIKDDFTREMLSKQVNWAGPEPIVGIIMLAVIIISLVYLNKNKLLNSFVVLYSGMAIALFIFLPLVAPRVESYVQGDAVQFYKSLKGRDCYVYALDIGNYRYGFYFYSDKQSHLSFYSAGTDRRNIKDWLLSGNIKYPAYIITKSGKAEKYIQDYGLTLLGKKNGLAYLKREK